MSSAPLAILLLLGLWTGKGDAACDYDNVETKDNLDLCRTGGRWYVTYSQPVPEDWENSREVYYDVEVKNSSVLYIEFTRFTADGAQIGSISAYRTQPDDPATWSWSYSYTRLYTYTVTWYILDTDYDTTLAFLTDAQSDGAPLGDSRSLRLAVRDPSQEPNMQVVADALRRNCGPEAASLDFFSEV